MFRIKDSKIFLSSNNRCGGYIFIEILTYISLTTIIISILISIYVNTNKMNAGVMNKYELKEISLVIEDKIRTELTDSFGDIEFEKDSYVNKKNIDNNMLYELSNAGYININKVKYFTKDRDYDDIVHRKAIFKAFSQIVYIEYISKQGKYQIGNYVESMFMKKTNIDNKYMKVDVILLLTKDNVKYVHYFQIFRKI